MKDCKRRSLFTTRLANHIVFYLLGLGLLVTAVQPAIAGPNHFSCTGCSKNVDSCKKESTLQCLYSARADYQEKLQSASPPQKPELAKCIKKINAAIEEVESLPSTGCSASTDKRQYVGVWRPGNHEEKMAQATGHHAFVDKWQELRSDGFRLVEVDTFVENGGRQYLGLFRREGGGNGFWDSAGWENFTQARESLAVNEGLRLVDLDTYVHEGKRFFIGVYVGGAYAQKVPSPKTWTDFQNERAVLASQGFQLVDVETFWDGGVRRFVGVYRAGSTRQKVIWTDGWKAFTDKWKELGKDDYQLLDVETFAGSQKRQFIGLLEKSNREDVLISLTSFKKFSAAASNQLQKGFRLVDIHVEPTSLSGD